MEPVLNKRAHTEADVLLQVYHKLCAMPFVATLLTVIQRNLTEPSTVQKKLSERWEYTLVTMACKLTYPSSHTDGPQNGLALCSRRMLLNTGSQESHSWLAITHQKCGMDVLTLCVMSRDNCQNSTLQFASQIMSNLKRSWSRKQEVMSQQMGTPQSLEDCANERWSSVPPPDPGENLESRLGGLSLNSQSNTLTAMLTDGWTLSFSDSFQNSTLKSSTVGLIKSTAGGIYWGPRYVVSHSRQLQRLYQSLLTVMSSRQGRRVAQSPPRALKRLRERPASTLPAKTVSLSRLSGKPLFRGRNHGEVPVLKRASTET